jgi:phenylalanine ammonia-lyase
LDGWKIDFAVMASWANALMAVLVDSRYNNGLPANLTPEPGANAGFKGMHLSVTSLACAVRQIAGPSSIHSLPTEEYNQDVVSLGMHAAVTALEALDCLRNETAMVLLAAAQAVDLRGGPARLAPGTRKIYETVLYSAIRRPVSIAEADVDLSDCGGKRIALIRSAEQF